MYSVKRKLFFGGIISTIMFSLMLTSPLGDFDKSVNAKGLTDGFTATPSLTPQSNDMDARTVKKPTSLRQGPSIAYPILTELSPGESITLIGISTDQLWVKGSTSKSQIGWLMLKNLSTDPLKAGMTLTEVNPDILPPPVVLNWKGNPIANLCLNVQTAFYGDYVLNRYTDSTNAIPGFDDQYGGNISAVPSVDVYSETGQLLAHFLHIPSEAEKCDAALTVEIYVNQLFTEYTDQSTFTTMRCFDGVKVDGTFTLESEKTKLVSASKKTRAPQKKITNCPKSSPYEYEMNWVLADGMHKLWGDAVMPYLLESPILGLPDAVVESIASTGKKGLPYLPSLIDLLDKRPDLSQEITTALSKVTGQKFGNDVQAWTDWWSEYQLQIQPTLTALQQPRLLLTPQVLATPGLISQWSSAPQSGEIIYSQIDPKVDQSTIKLVSTIGYSVDNLFAQTEFTSNGFQLVGEVQNNGSQAVNSVKITYQLLNNGRAVVQKGTIETPIKWIKPGEKGGFSEYFFGKQGIAGIRIIAISFGTGEAINSSYSFENMAAQTNEGNSIITGNIRNDSSEPVMGYNVTASFYNNDGLLVNFQAEQNEAMFWERGPIQPGAADSISFNDMKKIPYETIVYQAEPVTQ